MAAVQTIVQIMNQVLVFLLWTWPLFIVAFLFAYKYKWSKYPVEAIIIEKRGENLIKTNDRAGKYTDPYTKITGYRLHKAKDTMPVINFEWVLVNVPVNNTIFEKFLNLIRGNVGTLFLFRYGSKQYKPVMVDFNGQVSYKWEEIKDPEGNPVLLQLYDQFDPRKMMHPLDIQVIDWDNMNFMTQEQRASFERRKKSSEFWKSIALPLGALAITALVIIIMFKFSYDWSIAMAKQTPPTKSTTPNVPVVGDLIPGT